MTALPTELPGYELREGPPPVDEYLTLRPGAGLNPRRRDQAELALKGAWASYHVVARETGGSVGMGRMLGDGGWCFYILDMAVLPRHQRKGIGDLILTALLDKVRTEAPPGAIVNLLADEPGRRLYARHGFIPTGPVSIGMAVTLD